MSKFSEKLKRGQQRKDVAEHEEKMRQKREAGAEGVRQQKEERLKKEFKRRCDEALMPILQQVEKIRFANESSSLMSYVENNAYQIELKWGQGCDEEYNRTFFTNSIVIRVIRKQEKYYNRPEVRDGECVMVVLSTGVTFGFGGGGLLKEDEAGWKNLCPGLSTVKKKSKGFLGTGASEIVWDKKVTLNDPNYKEKVEAFILKQLGIE